VGGAAGASQLEGEGGAQDTNLNKKAGAPNQQPPSSQVKNKKKYTHFFYIIQTEKSYEILHYLYIKV